MAAKRPTLPTVPSKVKTALAELQAFAKARESIRFRSRKLRESAKKVVLGDASLPPAYRAFLAEYGYVWVEHYEEPYLKMIEPEPVCAAYPGELPASKSGDFDAAIAFQCIDSDSAPNFYCFNPFVDLGNGELEVVNFYGEDPREFALRRQESNDSSGFSEHLVACIDEFMDDYRGEE
jgi:hypothetical protein